MEGLDAILLETLLEGDVEGKTATEVMGGVQLVDPHLAGKKLPILIGSTEEMMMGEHQDVYRFEIPVEG